MMPVYVDPSQPYQLRPQGYNPQQMTVDTPPPCCYGGCVHNNFPAYNNAYWPPCYPPQVPYYPYCMNHHPHVSYAPPPPPPPCHIHPPFPVGYDTERDVPGKHCCGRCDLKNDRGRGVVIEEHVPEIEKGNHQGEVVPQVRSTNCSYPILWIPHENARLQQHGSSLGSGKHDQPLPEFKAPDNMTIQKSFPQSWHGCFPFDESTMKSLVQNQDKRTAQNGNTVDLPFDISKLKSLLQGQDIQKNKEESGQLPHPTSWIRSRGKQEEVEAPESSNKDRKRIQNGNTVEYPFDISKLKSLLQGQDAEEAQVQKNKEEPGQLSYPIFWIPSHVKQGDVEASDQSKESSNEGRNLESCSFDLHVNEGQNTQNQDKEGHFECNGLSEKSSVRNIPVENYLQEPRNIPVKLSEDHLSKPTESTKKIVKSQPVEDARKEHTSSSSKPSRLPPVCLRVDPLPKKKNGGSKSHSPLKQKEESITSGETKVASPFPSKKAESKTVTEACNVKSEEANKEMKMSEGSLNARGTEKESVESNSKPQEGLNWEIFEPCETKESRGQAAKKKTFTEEEAAKIIQSRYRGYDVRSWEPIKKMKKIATICEQMGDVKKRIQALQVSTDQHIEEKEIVIIGELVMNLLLQLDAVQGLHPSIRDYRKSLARELSSIQDKLDSLKNSSAIAEKEAVKEQVEINSQLSDSPLNLEHSQLAEENKMVSDSALEKDLLLSSEEHPISGFNRTDEELASEAEQGSRLFETLAMVPEPSEYGAVASSSTIPDKIREVETVVPFNTLSADGNGMTVTEIEEKEAVVESLEKPANEMPQVMEETRGTSFTQDPETVIEVSEAEAKVSENEDKKGDNDTVLPSQRDVDLSRLPVGGIEDETQPLSQDSSSYTQEASITTMDPETASQEETDVDHWPDNSKRMGQETSEPHDEKGESRERGVIVKEESLETGVNVKKQPPKGEVTEHDISEETKKLMEENQRLKETMETFVNAGREQLEVISKLTSRVKSLEKKVSHKKRTHIKRRRATKPMSASSTDVVL